MSEVPIFKLPLIVCDDDILGDILQALLNTIFFHRSLGPIELKYDKCRKLQRITYMKTGESNIDKDILNLITSIRIDPNVNLSFFEEENQKYFGFFKQRKQKIFEKWVIPIKLSASQNFGNQYQYMEDKLTEILLKITEIVNANYDHFDENFENNSTKALKYPYELLYNFNKLVE